MTDLNLMGFALRLRWLWLSKADPTKPWADLHDTVEPKVLAMFRISTTMTVGDGKRTSFWEDKWIEGRSIAELAPSVIRAVGPRIRKTRTVFDALHNYAWVRDITGARTVLILEYLDLWELIRTVQLQPDLQDKVSWKWTANGSYSAASAYRAYFIGQECIPGAKILHKARAPGKCNFFIWLALHDRCWTAERRKRHNLQDRDDCVLCGQHPESIDHLLLTCVHSREVWLGVLRAAEWHALAPAATTPSLPDWWTQSRRALVKEHRKDFDSLVLLVTWSLWMERNARTFNRRERTPLILTQDIIREAAVWTKAGYITLIHLQGSFTPQLQSLGREIVLV